MVDPKVQERFTRRCTDAAFGYGSATTAAYFAFAGQVLDFWVNALSADEDKPKSRASSSSSLPVPSNGWPSFPQPAQMAPAPVTPAQMMPFFWPLSAPQPAARPQPATFPFAPFAAAPSFNPFQAWQAWLDAFSPPARAPSQPAQGWPMPWFMQSAPAQSAPAPSWPMPSLPVQGWPMQGWPFQAMPVQAWPLQAWPLQAWPMAFMLIAYGIPSSVAWPTAEANVAAIDAADAAAVTVRQAFSSYRTDGGNSASHWNAQDWSARHSPQEQLMMLATFLAVGLGAMFAQIRVP